MAVSKNSKTNRGANVVVYMHNDKEIRPTLYYGKHAGHGVYMAAFYRATDELVRDANGKPYQFRSLVK